MRRDSGGMGHGTTFACPEPEAEPATPPPDLCCPMPTAPSQRARAPHALQDPTTPLPPHPRIPTVGRYDAMTPTPQIQTRDATQADLPTLVALLADDPLGSRRESTDPAAQDRYAAAFEAILADPNHTILVATDSDAVVGLLQLSFLPHLTYEGGTRAQIEGVRVAAGTRGQGIGSILMQAAIDRSQAAGCHLMQLTSDLQRPDAIRFYEGLGFTHSHVGMKLHFPRRDGDPS